MSYKGGCYCGNIRYEVTLASPDDARTSLCHCKNCKKWTGSAYGLTTKINKNTFKITQGTTTKHIADNGSGTKLTREFCGTCGSNLLEFGEHAGENIYICHGSLDDPNLLPPKGEFFCNSRAKWQPEIPGVFHKQEIKD